MGLDCSDQDERKFSQESRGDVRQTWDRQTDRYTSDRDSVYGSIAHMDIYYIHARICI